MPTNTSRRRVILRGVLGLSSGLVAPAWALPSKATGTSRPVSVAQIVDTSAGQLDVSKDFLIGSRAAWLDLNARGGINGRPVHHWTVEVDGSTASLRSALDTIKATPHCMVLCGTAGDRAASELTRLLRKESHGLAHAAPWLQDAELDGDAHTFPIFASRQDQIAQALKSLSVLSVRELGAVYASPREHALFHDDVQRASAALNIRLKVYPSGGDLIGLGRSLDHQTPRILLFVGGTPELVQFTQGIEKQAQQRYVIAMADVNLQTMVQMGAARHTPVMATQVVPMINSPLPVVRSYREALALLFDEPPTPQSLAGYIAARYTAEVLSTIDGPPTRQSALQAFQRRQAMDLGGFRVSFNAQGRGGSFVTQSMMTPLGRLIG